MKNPVADYESAKAILYNFLVSYQNENAEMRDYAIEEATEAIIEHAKVYEKIGGEKERESYCYSCLRCVPAHGKCDVHDGYSN